MRILIINASIATQNKHRKYIPHGFIVVEKDKIKKISSGNPKSIDFKKGYKVINANGLIVLPGFINAHVHLGESIFHGLFSGKYSLENYLRVTGEITQRTNLIEKERKTIADYSLLNLIKTGVTTICGGRVADLANQWGIRNVSGYMVMNSYKLRALSADLENQFVREYKKNNKTNICYPAIFLHSLNKIDAHIIPSVKRILKKFPDARLILHIAETKNQEEEVKERLGLSSVEFLIKNSLLNKKTILIHGNWLTGNDLQLVKKYQASVVQCLSSNINVADNVLNLVNVIKKDIKACLATDGLVTSGTFSVLAEAVKCFFYYKKRGQNISQQKCLDLITIDAAKVLGLDHIVGSIEKGKKADLVFCRGMGFCENNPLNNIKEVEGIVIDGVVKMWEYRLLGFNEKLIIKKFNTLSAKVKKIYEHF
jgi:5-methylthioadenosine/S-adenosylhomocysteine deaminase